MWSLTNKHLGGSDTASIDSEMKGSIKPVQLNPFEFTPTFFSRRW
jgi:hypothetical protein